MPYCTMDLTHPHDADWFAQGRLRVLRAVERGEDVSVDEQRITEIREWYEEQNKYEL